MTVNASVRFSQASNVFVIIFGKIAAEEANVAATYSVKYLHALFSAIRTGLLVQKHECKA